MDVYKFKISFAPETRLVQELSWVVYICYVLKTLAYVV